MQTHSQAALVAIVGPTAVGKTALAIELAQRMGGAIVNADSRQVYRQMNIGTAKPTPEQQATARHHLIDIIDPDQPFSLAVYQEQALQAIAAISGSGQLPLLVGGTGQYVMAVVEGWGVPRVAPQPELRARLEAEAAAQGTATLHERLREVDPVAAVKIEPNNLRRIIRALEVYEVTGEPISTQQHKQPPPYRITAIWLTMERPALYARIDARVDAMIAAGLLDEVRGLVERGYGWELPAMSSLGYREFQPYFTDQASVEECITRLKFNTHAFVRKQEMWFRRIPGVIQLAVEQPALIDRLAALITAA